MLQITSARIDFVSVAVCSVLFEGGDRVDGDCGTTE
jgi:hypothetical protein